MHIDLAKIYNCNVFFFFLLLLLLNSTLQWLINHPEYISNPVYIAGDSYSGITVPVLTQQISNGMNFFFLEKKAEKNI